MTGPLSEVRRRRGGLRAGWRREASGSAEAHLPPAGPARGLRLPFPPQGTAVGALQGPQAGGRFCSVLVQIPNKP